MEEFDENDPVWKALGRSPSAQASPYFVRRVLRDVRNARQAPPAWTILWRWLAPLGAAAAVAVTLTVWSSGSTDQSELNALFDSAADLDSLVAFEEASVWAEWN